MLASTDMPGTSQSARQSASSMTILTAMRWTTLVKFPVALSGGSSANWALDASASASTPPRSVCHGKGIHGKFRFLADIRRRIDCTVVSLDYLGIAPPRRQLDANTSRATLRIEAGSNPNLPCSAFKGADAPKVCMPITRPFGPM